MGKIYNIDLSENFLKRTAAFIKQNKNITEYTVILPNNRSCRKFKKYFLDDNSDKTIALPKINSISDAILFDVHKATMLMMGVIRGHNNNIPVNTAFDLSSSIAKLIKEFIINNIDYTKMRNLVPAHFADYWEHTTNIIYKCIKHPAINNMFRIATAGLRYFIESIFKNNRKIIAIGMGNINLYTRELMNAIRISQDGIIFTTSNEGSQNQAYNKEILKNSPYIDLSADNKNFLSKLEFAEFQNAFEEAQAVAMAVRQAVYEQKSVSIVVSNLDLLTKIKGELLQWNIVADDSYGDIFSETYHGLLASLILDVISNEFSTRSVLDVLKVSKSYSKYALKIELFLKQRKNFDLLGAIQWLSENSTLNLNSDFLEDIKEIYNKQLLKECGASKRSFSEWSRFVRELINVIDIESSQAFTEIIEKYLSYSHTLGDMIFAEYCTFLKKRCLRTPVRRACGHTPGVAILGVIEAQFCYADLIIIAGANANLLQISEQNAFWMNDSMMKTMNIPTNEMKDRFIHCIFEQLTYKKHVLITRSKRILGEQQVRHPFLEQISMLPNTTENTELGRLIKNAVNIHNVRRISIPSPNPERRYRPAKFSITDIELLKDNAYAFYGKKILKLKELGEIDEIKNLRGVYIHAVLDNFVKKRYGNDMRYTAKKTLEELQVSPSMLGFYFFRIDSVLAFVENNVPQNSFSEILGEGSLEVNQDYVCKIVCKADRMDINDDGGVTIIDYKTSSEKITKKDVESGVKMQLPLEGWIAQNDGFGLSTNSISSLQYCFLKKGCEKITITDDIDSTNELISKIIDVVRNLIHQYNITGIPYFVNVNDKFNKSYMHLARVKEWLDA